MWRALTEKLVTSGGEVLVAGNLSLPVRETALITLAHVALSNEDVEIVLWHVLDPFLLSTVPFLLLLSVHLSFGMFPLMLTGV